MGHRLTMTYDDGGRCGSIRSREVLLGFNYDYCAPISKSRHLFRGGNSTGQPQGGKITKWIRMLILTYTFTYLQGGTPRDHGRLPVDRTHQVSLCSAGLKAETHGKNINTQSICIVYHIAYVYGQDTQTTEIIETLTTWARGLFTPEIKEQKSRIENKNKPRLFFFFFA